MFVATLILGIITFLLVALHWYQKRSRFARLLNQFPTIPCKPLFGHMIDLSLNPEILFWQIRIINKNFTESYGSWSVYYGGVHIITPEDAEIVLSNVDYIKKGKVYEFLESWLNKGILTSNGEKWHHHRKIITPTFHFNILRRFVKIFGENSTELIKKLKNEHTNKETNIIPIFMHQTLSVICETAMGIKLNKNNEEHTKYLNAVHDFTPTVVRRITNPFLYSQIGFALSPLGFTQRRLIKTMKKFTSKIIKEREINFKESHVENLDDDSDEDNVGNKKKRLAMLDLLLSAKNRGEIDSEEIQEEVDSFVFGGFDTSAAAICFTLLHLAHHEEVQDKIIKELDEIFGDDDRPASYDDIKKMKYLDICIKESLRLSPIAPLITRKPQTDVKLTHHTVPAECEIFIHIYDIHRNKKYFPDPEKFDPDRFLPENCKGRHPYSYIPFSAGPRNCLGQKYAMFQIKSTLSSIFRNFTLEPISKFEELRWTVDVVLRVNSPINIRFIERK